MTVMAAEAGTGAAEAGASEASADTARTVNRPPKRIRTGGRTQQGTQHQRRATGGRTQQGTQGRKPVATRVASKAGPEGKAAAVAVQHRPGAQRRQAGGRPRRPQLIGGKGSNYKAVILGELLLAIIVVSVTPLARKNKGQVSPFGGQDLIQFAALLALYFILAVVAGTGQAAARFAAWFGGLILLAIGLGETSALVNTLAVFGGSNAQPAAQPASAAAANLPNKSTLEPNVGVTVSADTGMQTTRPEQTDIKQIGSPQ